MHFHRSTLPLNNEMLNFWNDNGYLIIENFKTNEECEKLINRSKELIDDQDFNNQQSVFDTVNQSHNNDNYFLELTSLNSSYLSTKVISCNKLMPSRILGILRTSTILLNYGIGYIFYPKRIIRTIKNLINRESVSSTVFEHRLKDLINRNRA